MITRYGIHKILKVSLYTFIVLVVLGYGLFATHDFIIGPTITLSEPINGSSYTKPDIQVKGVVKRIKDIAINGRPITIDDKGNFVEVVLLSPGYNAFELVASDKFGRSQTVRLELVYAVN